MRGLLSRLAPLCLLLGSVASSQGGGPTVVTAGAGSESGAPRSFQIRFSTPMVPLGEPRARGPFDISCTIAGTGRWSDQQSYVYEFAKPLPGGTRCTLALRTNLSSLDGSPLVGPRTPYILDTSAPDVRAILPARYGGSIQQDQSFLIATNVPANRASIAAGAYCAVEGIGEKLPVDLLPPDVPRKLLAGMKNAYQLRSFLDEAGLPEDIARKPGGLNALVALRCRRPLPPGRDMALVWPEGISGGSATTTEAKRFDYRVIEEFTARFECSRTNPRAGCSPVQSAHVRFSAPVPRTTAMAIRIRLPDGRLIGPKVGDGDRTTPSPTIDSVEFKLPADQRALAATLVMPSEVRDENGRPLANARRFPLAIRFDAAPPLAKFAANFGILEANEGGVLPLTVRNVEPSLRGKMLPLDGKSLRLGSSDKEVAGWLRRLNDAEESDFTFEKRGKEEIATNHTRDKPLLDKQAGLKPTSVAFPARGKAFEVVGIPLGKQGFYVVEVASPTLGQSLLGRDAVRYVATGALVTNMAVHFKWGRGSSLAWVTALDSAAPVAGAAIQVTDSCTGKSLARGTTDGSGRLLVRTELPKPETYGSCAGSSHPLMVSARKDGDFSFALTSWDKGLSPYDFDMPFEWEDKPRIFHNIFDRTLMRAGETVHIKHVLRRPTAAGFAPIALKGLLRLSHRGSDTHYDLPVTIGRDGIGLSDWTAPRGTPQGDYDLSLVAGEETISSGQSVRVDEYRLPTMRATVTGPKEALVRPKTVPVNLFVGYLSGGGAANLPVSVRASFDASMPSPKGWEGWSFGGSPLKEGITPLDDDNRDMATPLPAVQLLALSLDKQGTGRSNVAIPDSVRDGATLAVEMDYPDANGETLTAAQRFVLNPASLRLGIKTDGWLMKRDDLRLRLVVLDLNGKPVQGRSVSVKLYSREILSSRRRLVGGFYAYENNARVTRLKPNCTEFTDARGLALCKLDPGVSGEVYAVATVRDGAGNAARAVTSVWLAGDDWWFGGDNGDRMDVVPEQREYKATDIARFQVRMPFRSATALVTVEREGILSSFVTELSGKDPVVEVPLQGYYAPDVYVSVFAVRGRVAGWRLWLADFARRWHVPFFQDLAAPPTALVDLAKPSFRLGIARINVGWDAHRLAVDVTADRPKYHVRDRAQVAVRVTGPDGKAPKSAEIAFAAVDEALLSLSPNESWNILDAMMGERPLSVLTSTAQMQVIGKRHYGRKAVASGGGGGGDLAQVNREDFRPVLLWKGRVPLDANGMARVAVPMSDSLSAFRLVAIATSGAGSFGTGVTTVRTQQDLSIYSGIAPLVRSGDRYGASFTLRNGSEKPMTVTANIAASPAVVRGKPLTAQLPAGGAKSVTWWLNAPANLDRLSWTVTAQSSDGRSKDRMTVTQAIVPAVPLDVWAATLLHVGPQSQVSLVAPAGALPGRGGVEVRLTDSLAPPLDGVRRYMRDYLFDCFEQRLSKAVVAGDIGSWNRLAADMPAYVDRDGLLRYFPEERMDGSIALTAYALSITSAAGFPLPEGDKAKLISALQAVVEGRLTREVAWTSDNRVEKLAALAALARNGASTPALLGQIGMAPADMQSSALLDWIAALHGTPGADPAMAARAEGELRKRIAYEGSRFDFTDSGTAPWWMMNSGDEMANRALFVLIGRPGWQDDVPRLLVGAALRQQRGHWDTTTANAWGIVAAKRFATLYPPTAISGTTSANFMGFTRTARWPFSGPQLMHFRLPTAPTTLNLTHAGPGPWAQVQVTAAVPMKQPFFAGYRISRQVTFIQRRDPKKLSRGDVLKIRLTIDAGVERNWIVVNDPIPAGATIVGDLGGQSATLSAQASSGEGVQPSYVERSQDGWRGYFEWVPRGRFTVEYAVRLNAVGRFQLPPTRVQAMYSPEIRGALPNGLVSVFPQ